MDDAFFKPYDRVAEEKSLIFQRRREELEGKVKPPSIRDMYKDRICNANRGGGGDTTLRRSSHLASSPSASSPSAASPLKVASDVPPPEKSGSWTLYQSAGVSVDTDEANAWLEARGFDPDFVRKPGSFGWTPLHQACEESNLAVLEWLVSNGAAGDLRREDDAGITPLKVGGVDINVAPSV